MPLTLFGEIIYYIIEKLHHYDISTTRVHHGKGQSTFPSVDMDIQTRTTVAYPMQVYGLLPFTDTGKRTRVYEH